MNESSTSTDKPQFSSLNTNFSFTQLNFYCAKQAEFTKQPQKRHWSTLFLCPERNFCE